MSDEKRHKKVKKIKKVVKYNLKIFLLFVAVVMIWRSIWWLLDIYLFPYNHTLSYLITLLWGLLIIYIDEYELEDLVG
jgi:ABC-type xylose transport system permease subunit